MPNSNSHPSLPRMLFITLISSKRPERDGRAGSGVGIASRAGDEEVVILVLASLDDLVSSSLDGGHGGSDEGGDVGERDLDDASH